jgi:hypothetical protein
MIPPVKPFTTTKNGTDIAPTQLSSATPAKTEANKNNNKVNHNNLWPTLKKNQIDLNKQEKKLAKEWRLAGIDRLQEVVCKPETRAIVEVVQRIRTPNGREIRKTNATLEMNANIIKFNDKNFAVVAQYPTCNTNQLIPNMKQELTRHIQMLLDDQTPLLLVLASDTIMAKNNMFPYFSQSRDYLYDHVADFTRVRTLPSDLKQKNISQELNIASYQMKIVHADSSEDYRSEHTLTVIHLKNAPDRMFALTATQLHDLIMLINQYIDKKTEGQPVIIDASGTGPAAQVVVAMNIYEQFKAQRSLSANHVADMVQELRMQRSSHMIETQNQFDALLNFLKKLQANSTPPSPSSILQQAL